MSEADREYLSEQIIGQTPLLPPREPLGARLAGFMGRRHGVLMALCALLLWAAMTLRPPGEGEVYKRGAIAKDNIYAPRAHRSGPRLTPATQARSPSLGPTDYRRPPYPHFCNTLAELREISAARRYALQYAVGERCQTCSRNASGSRAQNGNNRTSTTRSPGALEHAQRRQAVRRAMPRRNGGG
jgi:hypothetical protein